MKILLLILPVLAMLNLSAQETDSASTDTAKISSTIAGFATAWNKHDVNAFSMLFAEDADFTNVVGQGGHGRAEVKEFYVRPFDTWFKKSNFKFIRQKIRLIKPDVASVDAWWEMSGTVSAGGKSNPVRKGLLSFVMTKQQGAWLFLVMHNTSLSND